MPSEEDESLAIGNNGQEHHSAFLASWLYQEERSEASFGNA